MSAAVSSCFGVDIGDVALNRTDTQDQFAGDFLVGPSARYQPQNLRFACGKPVPMRRPLGRRCLRRPARGSIERELYSLLQ
jgi:hypothetical protein